MMPHLQSIAPATSLSQCKIASGCPNRNASEALLVVYSGVMRTGTSKVLGLVIPPAVQERVRTRVLLYADQKGYNRDQFVIRFRGPYCYLDYRETSASTQAAQDPTESESMTHLCRLRYSGHPDSWEFAFFAYSSMKYEPSVFGSGSFYGSPDDALDLCAVYLGRD